MARFFLVDERDGRVLAALSGAEQAARLLYRLARSPDGDPPFRVVRLDHREGSLTGVSTFVSTRPLPPLVQRQPGHHRGPIGRGSRRPRRQRPPTAR